MQNSRKLIDFHIPVRKLSKRKLDVQTKPWITTAIGKSIQVKNKIYKNILRLSLIIILNLKRGYSP